MIERKIIIGLITSTEYCQHLKDYWNPQLLESDTAKRLATWVWEYFNQYGKAPGREIETIYFSKLKDGKLPKDIAEEIEQDILPDLSTESASESFNLDYLLEETSAHFSERHITLCTTTVETLIRNGKTEEAEKVLAEFRPLTSITGKLDEFILTAQEIRKTERIKPKTLMKPWLREGQLTIIYGNYGSGKSLLTMNIAYVLGLHDWNNDESEIAEWQVKQPTGCLYIDGELGELEMEERVKSFEWLGKQSRKHSLRILSIPEYQLKTEEDMRLSVRANQKKIVRWLSEHPTYKLVVLDSVSTLFGLEEENDNSEWNNKVNPLLRDLRAMGVACILLHHSGKDGRRGLRGASAMGAMAHNIFSIKNHEGKSTDAGEAWFILSRDKQRQAGKSFRDFGLHYFRENDDTETHWSITGLNVE